MNRIEKAKISGILGILFLVSIFCFIYVLTNIIISSEFEDLLIISGIGGIIIFLLIILTIVCFILSIYFYLSNLSYTNKEKSSIEHGKKILYERYAKGEISKEELEQMKKDIGGLDNE